MFTGIVEELGEVAAVDPVPGGARLSVSAPAVTADASHGDSISVDGVCLTVAGTTEDGFTVDVVDETLRRSTLGALQAGARVNLERAMALGDRLGGHIVQGHVDATGVVTGSEADGLTRVSIPERLSRYLVEKGSITVDGVSLTVVEAGEQEFSVALIPTTLEETTLGLRARGDRVNIEVDALAKHVERLLGPQLDQLARTGVAGAVDNGEGREQAR
ncbi:MULTISPECIES: riboflavin synthase [Actinopolyspora]|uniref:Riboflavin synthase n=1 Tax=Actinopolyspora saharensis TaxID=995062 RepID=A0A1H0Y7H8_9ACTN|nr:riboflavin synthase [Actinopolyspora saharensis]NHD17581.1 riboflavin synthase [Actinopolyspora sp. BKK2]NHE76686.1 riboflavin synthase [Actinopolyspora sp. BKK1]SDQ11139.1 riboflavin synthase alpha chain [Actinopolyspora saharensis]